MVRKVMKRRDPWSVLVINLTLILFVLALFIKGLTHDILLEAGVFLVSLKLILMMRHQSEIANSLEEKLEQIQKTLEADSPQKLTPDQQINATRPEPPKPSLGEAERA
jgi:hypothetical protein